MAHFSTSGPLSTKCPPRLEEINFNWDQIAGRLPNPAHFPTKCATNGDLGKCQGRTHSWNNVPCPALDGSPLTSEYQSLLIPWLLIDIGRPSRAVPVPPLRIQTM